MLKTNFFDFQAMDQSDYEFEPIGTDWPPFKNIIETDLLMGFKMVSPD